MRVLRILAVVVLLLVAALMAVVAGGLFLDGNGGAGVLATGFTVVSALAAGLLLRSGSRTPARPARRPRRDQGFYYGDASVSHGHTGGAWTGDGGADGRHDGGGGHRGDFGGGSYGDGGGSSGSDSGAGSGSDGGGGGSDGGGGSSD